ncbi:sarcosine dehydrogenase, mitochondrial-like [Culicoides brevitarsis]|uniref:sarcosine dehydrogenase, mitochondrial-like n=1 Tax=Culicoides brevitarsis TaxID=469753 RepID=UPI00307C0531
MLRVRSLIAFLPKTKLYGTRLLSTTSGGVAEPKLPTTADVIIVGGGVTGCSILYQLSKKGVNAVLLERGKITCGTTFHTAGLIWSLRPNALCMEVLKTTKEVFQELGAEDVGWINNGTLFLAHDNKEMKEFEKMSTFARNFGIESHVMGAKEATEMFPLLSPDSFKGALFSPSDGVVDPSMLCNQLVKKSKANGCSVVENCPVTKIITTQTLDGGRKVTGVVTPYGDLMCGQIINARGLWSQEHLAHASFPFTTLKHSYVVTEPIPNVKRCPNVRDHNNSIYFRVQGDSLIVGGYEENPTVVNPTPPEDFQFQLYNMDWNTFNPLMSSSIKLLPSLNKTGVKSTVCGPEAFSMDRKPLIGPDRIVRGLFHSFAFSSNGMMLSGGCAEQVAEWIVNGEPSLDMSSYDIERFAGNLDRMYVQQQCVSNYAKRPTASLQ